MSARKCVSPRMLALLAGVMMLCAASYADAETRERRFLGSIERLDPALDKLVLPGTAMKIIGRGYDWSEGPVWVPSGGYLLFSDIPRNSIYKSKEGEFNALFLRPSGYTGAKKRGGEVGSNGLLLDTQGRLVLCQHGDRRIARLAGDLDDPQPKYETLADRYEGKRLNSPNDAVYHSNGDLYFTDPPYGLEKGMKDPAKELDFQGVYRLATDGTLTLLTDELSRPNGIALSPDEKTLYVANSDGKRPIWMSYALKEDGTLGEGRVFHDASKWVGKRPGGQDGMAVDVDGNVFATGPGGVWVFNPEGKHLGTLLTTQRTSNCTFGGKDGNLLFITADMYILQIALTTRGKGT